ncbi:MAG: TraB/GumN family protein [Prevotellaceae bacterium]|jgi:uncharacterized protein YbaP (TraB family)|nr:TraB/GumN family protein [Prevotellaceae bacterium]
MRKLEKILKTTTLMAVVTGCLCCGNSQNFKTSDKFSLLWEISGNGLSQPSFLYGTIHLYDTLIYRLPKEIFEAIDLCDNFALEVDMNKIDQQTVMRRSQIPYEDSTLNILFGDEIYNEIQQIPIVRLMGDRFKFMKPFFIQVFLMVENPLSIQPVEAVLNTYALEQNKNIFGIETIDEQLDAMDKISLAEQARGIIECYDYAKKANMTLFDFGKKTFRKLSEAYRDQNTDILKELEQEFKMISSTPAFDSIFLKNRNINMANRIDNYIKDGKTLFAGVGMAHILEYNDIKSVVSLLKEKGYNLRPILIDLHKKQ